MATYGDAGGEYPYKQQKEEKKVWAVITKIVDFAQLPITSGNIDSSGYATTAFASGDVLQMIGIKANETVMGVQVEILTKSVDAGDSIDVGYGGDTDRWGRYDLSSDVGLKEVNSDGAQIPDMFFEPVTFSSADTIDLIINKAALAGKIKLTVYILKPNRK